MEPLPSCQVYSLLLPQEHLLVFNWGEDFPYFQFSPHHQLRIFQLWYLLYNGFSGQIIFDPWIIILYNMVSVKVWRRRINCILSWPVQSVDTALVFDVTVFQVFTVLPPFTLGLFEKLCSAESMRAYPQLYSVSQTSKTFNTIVFWLMCANATLHSALLYFIPFLAFSHGGYVVRWIQHMCCAVFW